MPANIKAFDKVFSIFHLLCFYEFSKTARMLGMHAESSNSCYFYAYYQGCNSVNSYQSHSDIFLLQ